MTAAMRTRRAGDFTMGRIEERHVCPDAVLSLQEDGVSGCVGSLAFSS